MKIYPSPMAAAFPEYSIIPDEWKKIIEYEKSKKQGENEMKEVLQLIDKIIKKVEQEEFHCKRKGNGYAGKYAEEILDYLKDYRKGVIRVLNL